MLIFFAVRKPLVWMLPLIIQVVCYMKILGKMGKNPIFGLIPPLAEYKMSEDLFHYMHSFWRPLAIYVCMLATAAYIGTSNQYGIILVIASLAVYWVFLARLYWRLSRQFGKGVVFSILLIFVTCIFLPVLAFDKSWYLGKRDFSSMEPRSKTVRALFKAGAVLISVAEFAALIAACFWITILARPLRPVAQYMLNDTLRRTASVSDSDEIVSREDTLGTGYEAAVSSQRSRDYFFPDHSSDKKVVVMEYIIGADLEDARGSASFNISQMKDATAKGDGLDFVVQAGGSERWFTSGIKDSTVGRYLISGGRLTESEMLDSSLSMSDPECLRDFIVWTKENYPADRYMLVLWDHGGGFVSGYGYDNLNKRSDGELMMSASEMINAVKEAGVKFDLIGYDACLMQDIEYANAFEPYADYYLASEETEPAYGWYYTEGFGRLAEDPALSTEEFGRIMISSYDQMYRAIFDGEPQADNTLSLVDLTLVRPVYKKMAKLYRTSADAIKDNSAVFTNISAARSKCYEFYDGEQIDLISFLSTLKNADYKQEVAKDEKLDEIINSAKACVVYRNKDAAEGANGLSTDFPYTSVGTYSNEYKQLKAVRYKAEESFFNNFCSIMLSQQLKIYKDKDDVIGSLSIAGLDIYTKESWYINGFEDYDTTSTFVDIPVTETEDGYLPELPDKTWASIVDCSTDAYMVTEDGLMYLGREHFEAEDAEGHPLTLMEDRWVNVGGQLVCYETETPLSTEEGTIYKGTVQARLNGKDDITLYIEWDAMTDDSDDNLKGHITGYSINDDDSMSFMKKGLEQLETGDTLEFLFDYYDEEGKLKETKSYGGKLTVVTQDMIEVREKEFESGTEVEYYGVLTDVYQRELMTEAIRERVED